MSSSSARDRRFDAAPLSAPWCSVSITGRMALFYSVLAFVVLAAAITALYWALTASLAQDDQRFLNEKFHVLSTMLRQRPNDMALLREEVDWETGVLGHARYFVQILSQNGTQIIQTPGLNRSGINEAAFPPPAAERVRSSAIRWFRTDTGRRYLLSAVRVRLGGAGPVRIVRVAFDVSHEDRILSDFLRIACLVLATGVALSGLMGGLLAQFGLRPFHVLTRTVEATTALKLDQRIDPAAWPAEFVPLAKAFNDLLKHLEEAFARLSGYAGDLAHELRTPLNNLMGEAEVILARPRSCDEYRSTLVSSLEEFRRLARTIDSLLFLARADSAEQDYRKVMFDVGSAVTEVLEYYRPVAEEAGVLLGSRGSALLTADRDLFRRALSNLVDNAIRHSACGDCVTVSLTKLANGSIKVEVVDVGEGIAPADQARVFERFFRGERERRRGSGSGLGLSIVKSIMQLHGGDVKLCCEPGHGTCVTLTFPAPETMPA